VKDAAPADVPVGSSLSETRSSFTVHAGRPGGRTVVAQNVFRSFDDDPTLSEGRRSIW